MIRTTQKTPYELASMMLNKIQESSNQNEHQAVLFKSQFNFYDALHRGNTSKAEHHLSKYYNQSTDIINNIIFDGSLIDLVINGGIQDTHKRLIDKQNNNILRLAYDYKNNYESMSRLYQEHINQ